MSEVKEEFVFFWGGEFSQWYKRDMVIDGITYNCCEQFMMAEKARLFGDEEALQSIMEVSNPRRQKAIGRTVQGFVADEWNENARSIVFLGNQAKFTQHQDLEDILLETGTKTIVEASPYDKVWGIGLAADDVRASDRSQWQGTNWLGEAIMKVRETIVFDAMTG
jgi:ribA/ribD-fused uncharacterized protein